MKKETENRRLRRLVKEKRNLRIKELTKIMARVISGDFGKS